MRAVVVIKSMQENEYFDRTARQIFSEVEYLAQRPDRDTLNELLGTTDVLIIGAREKIDAEMIQGKSLRTKIIGTLSVGCDHLDTDALSQAGIAVVNCPTANVRSVAEHVIAAMFALLKELKTADAIIQRRGGRSDLPQLPIEAHSRTLGLIGYGRIGSLTGQLAHGIGMEVLATSPSKQEGGDGIARFTTLDELLASSDVISISVPLTSSTRGLIDAQRLAKTRRGCLLINTSRADVTDQAAIAVALSEGHLGGYSGDHDTAPDELLNRDNVILTPHIAGITQESNDRLDNELIDRLSGVLHD